MYYNSRNNRSHTGSRNNSRNRGGRSTGAQYVWQVSWYPPYGNKKYKSFANKQQAMIFMSKLKSGNNYFVDIEKWFGN